MISFLLLVIMTWCCDLIGQLLHVEYVKELQSLLQPGPAHDPKQLTEGEEIHLATPTAIHQLKEVVEGEDKVISEYRKVLTQSCTHTYPSILTKPTMHVIQEQRMMRERGIRGASNHRNSIGLKTCFCLTIYGSLSTILLHFTSCLMGPIRKYSWLLWLDQCCATPAVPHCDATVRCSFSSQAPHNTCDVRSHIPTNWTISWIEERDGKEWEESLGTLSPPKGTLYSPLTGNKIMAGKSEHWELRVCNFHNGFDYCHLDLVCEWAVWNMKPL